MVHLGPWSRTGIEKQHRPTASSEKGEVQHIAQLYVQIEGNSGYDETSSTRQARESPVSIVARIVE